MAAQAAAPASAGAWDGRGPYPPSASSDAHHTLSEYHNYAALVLVLGVDQAEHESGAGAAVHATRLAAALGELLRENAVLRVLAAPAEVAQ